MGDVIVNLLWAIAPGIITGIVMAVFSRKEKKRSAAADDREKRRLESEKLQISLLLASAQLSYATTMAMKRGSTNGEVEPAVRQYTKAMDAFRNFEREQVAKTGL